MLFHNLYEDILVRQKLKTKQGNPLIIGVCVCVCVYTILKTGFPVWFSTFCILKYFHTNF